MSNLKCGTERQRQPFRPKARAETPNFAVAILASKWNRIASRANVRFGRCCQTNKADTAPPDHVKALRKTPKKLRNRRRFIAFRHRNPTPRLSTLPNVALSPHLQAYPRGDRPLPPDFPRLRASISDFKVYSTPCRRTQRPPVPPLQRHSERSAAPRGGPLPLPLKVRQDIQNHAHIFTETLLDRRIRHDLTAFHTPLRFSGASTSCRII